MTEHELQNQIRIALSEYGLVFRTNAGTFYQGKRRYSREWNQWALTDLRAVSGLPSGFPDLLFIDQNGVAFIEVKTKGGKKRADQLAFIQKMQEYGHRAGFAYSVADAVQIVKGEPLS